MLHYELEKKKGSSLYEELGSLTPFRMKNSV